MSTYSQEHLAFAAKLHRVIHKMNESEDVAAQDVRLTLGAFADLTQEHKTVLQMRYWSNMPIQSITAKLRKNASPIIERALNNLHQKKLSLEKFGVILSVRTYNSLMRGGIPHITNLLSVDCQQLLQVRNLGYTGVGEIIDAMEKIGQQIWVDARRKELETLGVTATPQKPSTPQSSAKQQKTMSRDVELKLYGAAVNTEQPYSFLQGAAWVWEQNGGSCSGFLNGAFEAYPVQEGTAWLRAFGKRYFEGNK